MLQAVLPIRWRRRFQSRFDRLISRRMRPPAAVQRLESRSTYVLPTGYGIFFAAVLYTMLMGSMNYSNNMGFMLTFLLTGIALVGMLYTYRNLSWLRLHAGRAKPVFAGDPVEFPLILQTGDGRPAYRIDVGLNRRQMHAVDIPENAMADTRIRVPTRVRGVQRLGRIRTETVFPLGLFRVWSWVALDAQVLVYPKPAGNRRLPRAGYAGEGRRNAPVSGNDDFAGIRRYQPSDPPTHIAWKAFARGHDVLTKQFSGVAGDDVWLDWDSLPDLDVERRLSQLCQWVLTLHYHGRSYGLRLPGRVIAPGIGEQHKTHCLEALALF